MRAGRDTGEEGCDGRSQSVTDAETVPLLAAMFEQMGFVARYSIPYDTLVRFLLTVRRSYRKVPYHNWRCVPPPLVPVHPHTSEEPWQLTTVGGREPA